ncbi:SDR family oxidoreductase [Nesterenkonia flava]|uniref:SDR family oxidoreductase n=1 Tax=Nesterenkonia flava TaxID=469799 RepID=A0ABU1FSB6_9MICC|nr:SDR family oxidoreductase [Nesterenkonia flava]MDR5711539.1 SDR family oxidoreductase [Nesterenkonia flava]
MTTTPRNLPADPKSSQGSGMLTGHRILITGATHGLGRAIARRAALEGASHVVITGRDAAAAEHTAQMLQDLGTHPHVVLADLADREQVLGLLPEALERAGALDGLVNAAGISTRGGWLDSDPDLLDLHLAVNLRAPFLLLQGFIRHRVEAAAAGSAVNIASMSAHGGQPFLAPYSTAKSGLLGMTKNAAYAHRWDRIRVNALNIGWSKTDGEKKVQTEFHGAPQTWLQEAEASQPMGQLGDPEQIAEMVTYLLSPRSGVVTGSIIDWDQTVPGAAN